MVVAVSEYDEELCLTQQREEWEVLESIFPDCVSGDITSRVIKLEIPVEFPELRLVEAVDDHTIPSLLKVVPSTGPIANCKSGTFSQSLSTLPPLLLDILLPSGYPYMPPELLSLHATHSWLPSGLDLEQKLLEMWQEGEGVLYTWIEWIRSGEFLETCGLLSSSKTEQVICIPHPAPHLLLPLLMAHESSTQLARFSETSYACEICLTSIKGARCILLSCSHVFCRSCLENFWKLCIMEGDVGRVGCPDPRCVKDGREANEEEVRRVVTEEEVRRCKWLREKRELEKDPSIVHCPLSFCQRPIARPQNVEEGSGWERLRTCPECGYSFCAYCKRTWHGSLADCPISATESFVLEYIALPEGSPERERMEQRFGRANIRKLVAKLEEEQANKKWLDRSTMACPTCHVHVEKSLGCNHMTCAKCREHFCYLCGERLQASNPYAHFSTAGRRCFSRLFDLQSVDDEWQPVEGFEVL